MGPLAAAPGGGGFMGAIAEGVAFGVGSSIARSMVGNLLGSAGGAAPPPPPAAAPPPPEEEEDGNDDDEW